MPFMVTRDHVKAYSAVIGQPVTDEQATGPVRQWANAPRQIDDDVDDVDVPLTYFMATGWSDLVTAGSDELERRGATGAPLTLVHYHLAAARSLVIGEVVHTDVEILGLASAPGGAFLTIRHDTHASTGERIAQQRSVVLVRGLVHPERNRHAIPRSKVVRLDPPLESTTTIESDYPLRFAEVSGDENPIHLDRSAALAAGFTDVVVHGMALLARCLTSDAVRDSADLSPESSPPPGGACEVSCQFGRPAHPGDVVTVRASPVRVSAGRTAVAFGATTPRGASLKQGVVVFGLDGLVPSRPAIT